MNKLNLLLIVLALSCIGCKKGEEDPTISLRSRKTRICKEWRVSEGTSKYYQLSPSNTNSGISTYNELYTTSDVTIAISNGYTGKGRYTYTFEIKEDGTYNIYKNIELDDGNNIVETERGAWYFLTKNKDLKTKTFEIIAFQPTRYNTMGLSVSMISSNPVLYRIIELRNDKLHLERIYSEIVIAENPSNTEKNEDLNFIPVETKK